MSRLRSALRKRLTDLRHVLKVVFGRSVLIKGNVYELARKCGKPNCPCARGELHRSRVLTWSEKGQGRLLSLPRERVLEVKRKSEEYLRFRRARAKVTEIHRAIAGKNILRKLAGTYPSPCRKHDVPVWVYIASEISMRFHGVHSFHAFPYVVRSGGMVQAFGPEMGHRAVHPETGDISLACEGFNQKNTFDRQTPCDQDYVRKMARRTDPELLLDWFNGEVVGIFKQHHAFDRGGIFIGDATYLFVPDNPNYENSSRMLFDEHNHPVEASRLTAKERARCTWKRCYKLVSLIHTNRAGDFFLYAGLGVTAGQDHEAPLLYRLVETFVGHHGRG